jgi:prepilin-type N-terminal cleavage/methylation domain-containing protein
MAGWRQDLSERGFGLLEVAIVVAMLGIALAISAPAYESLTAKLRLDDGVRQLVTDLRAAQQAAMAQTTTHRVQFFAGRYVVERDSGAGNFAAIKQVDLPRRIVIVTPPAPVMFVGSGAATGQTIRLRNTVNTERHVLVTSGTGRVRVVIP